METPSPPPIDKVANRKENLKMIYSYREMFALENCSSNIPVLRGLQWTAIREVASTCSLYGFVFNENVLR